MTEADMAPAVASGKGRYTAWIVSAPHKGSPNPPKLVQTWGWTGNADMPWPRAQWAPDR